MKAIVYYPPVGARQFDLTLAERPETVVPPLEAIPKRYTAEYNAKRTSWPNVYYQAAKALLDGRDVSQYVFVREGVCAFDALHHIAMLSRVLDICLYHRVAAMAYLLNQWFLVRTRQHKPI